MTNNLDTVKFYSTLAAASLKSVALLHDEIIFIREGYSCIGRDSVFDFSKKKKIIPFIAHLLCKLEIDVEYWEKYHEHYTQRNKFILDVLDKLFKDFNRDGINKIFVYENFGALLSSNSCIGCFSSGDIDMYADVKQKKMLSLILGKHGFFPRAQSPSVDTVKTEYYNPKLFEDGFGLNVMWKPLSRTKLPFNMDTENFINWDDLREFPGTAIRIPEPNTLMYLCLLHISVHSFSRSPALRLYIDVDRVAIRNLDWNQIATFASRDKTEVRIFVASILANKILGTSVPQDLVKKANEKYKKLKFILYFVFDSYSISLKKEPSPIKVLYIEILSSDYFWIKALWQLVFPSPKWIREYYLFKGGTLLWGYFKHIINLL